MKMTNDKNKINSVSILLNNCGKFLWKILIFSLADNFFSFARVFCISIQPDGLYLVYGTKIFWRISIKYFKKYELPEDKLPTPEHVATVVSRTVQEQKATGATFVIAVPRAWAIIQSAEFPSTVKENLSAVVSYELDRLTPLTPDNAYYDFKVIAEKEEKISILLTVVRKDQVNPYIAALQGRNIKIEKLGISSFAIKSLIKRTYNEINSVFVMVNDKACECGVIINGLTVGSAFSIGEPGDSSGIDSIIRDTRPLLDVLTKRGGSPQIVISAAERHYQLLRGKLGSLPLLNLNRDLGLGLPKGDRDISAVALGSFLEAATADEKGFNLLSGQDEKRKRTPFISTLVLLIVMALIVGFYYLAPVTMEQKKVEEIDRRIGLLKPELKKVEALRKEEQIIAADIKNIDNFKKQSSQSIDILKEMTAILPAKTWLTRMRITENTVEIEGYAASATEIVPKLENSRYFQKVEFASPTFRDPRQNSERFVIKMELRHANRPKQPEETGKKNEKKK
jgi:Tfp pilus assembly protein PilN